MMTVRAIIGAPRDVHQSTRHPVRHGLLSKAFFSFVSRYWFSRTGVFYYFFLDYRQKWALVSYLALIGAVSGFFALGDILSNALKPRVDF